LPSTNSTYNAGVVLGRSLALHSLRLALAESCSGGAIAHAVTDIPGSSNWFERGFVTYSNEAKQELLAVRSATLARCGAVSMETALEMAQGALSHSRADLALAVTGIAGPDGGSELKPVGTVFVAWQFKQKPAEGLRLQLHGNRLEIRQQVTLFCLQQLNKLVENT
jgi:nicotinamide-nucleotide amidase